MGNLEVRILGAHKDTGFNRTVHGRLGVQIWGSLDRRSRGGSCSFPSSMSGTEYTFIFESV